MSHQAADTQGKFPHNPLEYFPYSAGCKPHNYYVLSLLPVGNNYGGRVPRIRTATYAVPFSPFSVSPSKYCRNLQ